MSIKLPSSVRLPQAGLLEALGTGIGSGMQAGLQSQMQLRNALALEKQKQKAKEEGFSNLMKALGFGMGEPSAEGMPQGEQRTGQQIPVAQQEDQMSNLERIATNPQAMAAISAYNPQIASQLQQMYGNVLKQRESEKKMELAERKVETAESKDYRHKIEEKMSDMPDKRMALLRIRNAMNEGDLKSFQNFWGDFLEAKGLPGEYVRTSSASALQSAVKELLLSDIGRIKGGRPNQFIERSLSQSYPKAGYDPKANEKIYSALEMGLDVAEKEIEIYDKISKKYESIGKVVPGNVATLVNRELKPYVTEREKQLVKKYKEIDSGTSKKISPSQNTVRIVNPNDLSQDYMVTPENAKKAKEAGWRIVH